jgi:hypothetical protein
MPGWQSGFRFGNGLRRHHHFHVRRHHVAAGARHSGLALNAHAKARADSHEWRSNGLANLAATHDPVAERRRTTEPEDVHVPPSSLLFSNTRDFSIDRSTQAQGLLSSESKGSS